MKTKSLLLLFLIQINSITHAQNLELPVDSIIVTEHSTKIKEVEINYLAQTGTQPVWDKNGEVIASLFYTYYKRVNSKKKEDAKRPLIISFNGGPGSASVWMHVAYTGPKILNVDSEGYPVQPYGIKNNPYSIIDVADIVFVNPVNTGYSRMIKNSKGEMPDREIFFGINEDIK